MDVLKRISLTCRTPAEWSELWTPRPAALLRLSASCTSSEVCTLPAKQHSVAQGLRVYIQ